MSRGRTRAVTPVVLLLVVAGVAVVLWQVFGDRVTSTADLFSMVSAVQRLDGATAEQEDVATGDHRDMHAGDGVTVDTSGRARLQASGCVMEVFRETGLAVQEVPGLSAPACVVQLTHGTLAAQVSVRTVVNTEWAVVTAWGTGFFVHLDVARGLLWVIVQDGEVQVEADGVVVVLTGGEQTWVARGNPPEGVRPATRAEVGDLFPSIEDLTNGELTDADLLLDGAEPEPAPEPEPEPEPEEVTTPPDEAETTPLEGPTSPSPPTEPAPPAVAVDVTQSTDQVGTGECPSDWADTLTVYAALSGTSEDLAEVETVVLWYRWPGIEWRAEPMTFSGSTGYVGVIDPLGYTGNLVELTFVVQVLNADGVLLTSADGVAALRFCLL